MTMKPARGAVCALLLSFTLGASSSWAATNPLGIAFKTTTNVQLYAKPTGMLITGRCNAYDPAFAAARKKGAEVLMYLAPVERPDNHVCALDTKFYMNNIAEVPLWPWPSYGVRYKYPGTHLTDMRPGSAWILHVVRYVEGLMREGKVDGVFLDSAGARVWQPLAQWNSWSTKEKNAWTDGTVDLVRRLDAKRRAINPFFIIVNNGVWDRGDSRGLPGERYVDGIMLEHHKVSSAYHKKYVARPFGNLGQRRVLIVANSRTEAQQWAKVPGVTHVSDQATAQYKYPNPPAVPFSYLGDREQ
jgi:hypothetical protein